jgi:hypothetical protein
MKPNSSAFINDLDDAPALDLQSLQWMAGTWVGSIDGDRIEEHWSSSEGDTLMGMFRWLKGDDVYLYEFMLISKSELGVTLQIKHFRPDFVGWEEKDAAVTFYFQTLEDNTVTFDNGKYGDLNRVLQYTLTEGGQLISTVYSSVSGEPNRYEFIYSRR